MNDAKGNGKRKVMLVPCSGLGKTLGTVSREAAYEVLEDLRPDETGLTPLALLVLGDDETRAALADNPAVTIDGCKLACATKMVQESGGTVARDFAVLDAYRRHREFKPQGIADRTGPSPASTPPSPWTAATNAAPPGAQKCTPASRRPRSWSPI